MLTINNPSYHGKFAPPEKPTIKEIFIGVINEINKAILFASIVTFIVWIAI